MKDNYLRSLLTLFPYLGIVQFTYKWAKWAQNRPKMDIFDFFSKILSSFSYNQSKSSLPINGQKGPKKDTKRAQNGHFQFLHKILSLVFSKTSLTWNTIIRGVFWQYSHIWEKSSLAQYGQKGSKMGPKQTFAIFSQSFVIKFF